MNLPAFVRLKKPDTLHTWCFIRALAKRGAITREQAAIAFFGDCPPPSPRTIDGIVRTAREWLLRHGVSFETRYAGGWAMTRPMQIRTQAIIERVANGRAI